ncbi:hypothetical protein EMGBS13_01300 [Actinomycetota bacterium]|nr:hypothetical protein EMGBS13_01300 [Actinomycetota bacterium]
MFISTNPSDTNDVIATVPEATAAEILAILRTAKNAQKVGQNFQPQLVVE